MGGGVISRLVVVVAVVVVVVAGLRSLLYLSLRTGSFWGSPSRICFCGNPYKVCLELLIQGFRTVYTRPVPKRFP